MNETTKEKKEKAGIGGWLLLPALYLVVQPISMISKLGEYKKYRALGYHVYWIVPNLVMNIVFLVFVGLVINLFFRKRRLAPAALTFLIMLVYLAMNIVEGLFESADAPLIAMIFTCLVLPPYLLFSRRVQNTFVKPLNSDNPLDYLFLPIENLLAGFYRLLQRLKFWFIPLLILFMTVGIVLSCMFQAARIDGSIWKFSRYLF